MVMAAAVAAALASVAHTTCYADLSAPVPPYMEHYMHGHASLEYRPHHRRHAHRTRRQTMEVASDPDVRPALGVLEVVGTVSTQQYRAIARAYRHVRALFDIPVTESPVDLTIIANVSGPESNTSYTTVGSWDGTYIYVYLDAIARSSSPLDQLYMVVIHEILHALAFTNTDYGSGSFSSRSGPEFVYTGTEVAECTDGATVRTDDTRAHWSQTDAWFAGDIQTPVLSGSARISPCTAAAVIESRATWVSRACNGPADCPSGNQTCVPIGNGLGGQCLEVLAEPVSTVHGALDGVSQFPAFAPFITGVIVFFRLLALCATRVRRVPGLVPSASAS